MCFRDRTRVFEEKLGGNNVTLVLCARCAQTVILHDRLLAQFHSLLRHSPHIPDSMECGDSSPPFGEGFSLHNLPVGPARTTITDRGGTRASNPSNGRTRSRAPIHALSGASSGRTRSSGPLAHVRSSIRSHRARQACPSVSRTIVSEKPARRVHVSLTA